MSDQRLMNLHVEVDGMDKWFANYPSTISRTDIQARAVYE